MSIPPYGYAQPTLTRHEASYQFVNFGGNVDGHAYHWVPQNALTGWFDIPPEVTGDVQKDLDQGELAGLDVLPGRDMIAQCIIAAGLVNGASETFDVARQTLGGALSPAGEQPLFFQLDTGLWACMARPRNYACPYDFNFEQGNTAVATMKLHSTDPRWYLQPTLQTTIAASGAGSGTASLDNTGTFEMRPYFVITGTCTNPRVTNQSLNGAPYVEIDGTLAAGDTLYVDMLARTAVYVANGTTVGVSWWSKRTVASTPWNLPPGSSTVAFSTATHGSGCSCVVQWAPALLAL